MDNKSHNDHHDQLTIHHFIIHFANTIIHSAMPHSTFGMIKVLDDYLESIFKPKEQSYHRKGAFLQLGFQVPNSCF
jgi:pectate lyase